MPWRFAAEPGDGHFLDEVARIPPDVRDGRDDWGFSLSDARKSELESGSATDRSKARIRWPLVVINLDRSRERLDEITRHLEGLGLSFTRIPAVDGEALPPETCAAFTRSEGWRGFKRPLVRAEIGCYLSHLAVWWRIASGEHPAAFVLEDDARLADGAAQALASIAGSEPDWDILKICYGPLQDARPLGANGGVAAVLPRRMPPCTIGYAITRPAAARLVARSVPFSRPVDTDLKYWWEHGACIKITDIPLGTAAADHKRTGVIGAQRNHAALPPVSGFLANFTYQTIWQLGRLLHRKSRRTSRQWQDRGPERPEIDPLLKKFLGLAE